MYARITGEDPYETPMRIYPAVHYTMGGLWVDYDLESTIPGLFVAGEANFSDHGANRLGASAPHAGPGGRLLRPAEHDRRLPRGRPVPAGRRRTHPRSSRRGPRCRAGSSSFLSINGDRTVDSFHRELGHIMWEYCGMERSEEGLREAIGRIRALREEFWDDVRVPGANEQVNQSLEKAGRVADFLELGELMCIDALQRRESCGGHFRVESQTADGEALRDDDEFAYVAAWEYGGDGRPAGPAQGTPRVRVRPAEAAELQVKITLRDLAPGRHATRRAGSSPTSVDDVSPDMSFLEMLDVLNEDLIAQGEEPIAFDHDCREGICGCAASSSTASAHGPQRHDDVPAPHALFEDGDSITIEPLARRTRSRCSRTSSSTAARFDRIIQAGGYISVQHRRAPPRRTRMPVPKVRRRRGVRRRRLHRLRRLRRGLPERVGDALHSAPRSPTSAMLPQGQPERDARVVDMLDQHDEEGFGGCTNIGDCATACPKEIPLDVISQLNKDLRHSLVRGL